jgi:dTDP-4-dehydrorhamnose reductase
VKILVTGACGMLGKDIVTVFTEKGVQVVGVGKSLVDITDIDSIHNMVDAQQPTHIINCAGYAAVDAAEHDQQKCFDVNVTGVKNLVAVCAEKGIRLVQVSTDFVFDGSKQRYDESDIVNPINYYGDTKAQAEQIIIDGLSNYAIVRTSWLFGAHGKNFVTTILSLAESKKSIRVVDDQIGCPTYTIDFAAALCTVLEKDSGIYHIRNGGFCSWFAFASEIARLSETDCVVEPCTSKEYKQEAKRPAYSILENNKLMQLRSWQEALQEYINKTAI